MSRNTDSHFGNVPMKNIRRSSFKKPFRHLTTANTGEIVPIYAEEVLPGSTYKVHTASLVRMLTPISPTMDNAWLDTYFFFVPRRLVWDHWREFMGENRTDAWTQETPYQIPKLKIPSGGWNKGTIGEKLYGIQGRAGGTWVDACYARAYTLIFNEWFRNENITEPAELSTGDADTNGSNGNSYVTDMQKGGALAKAVKYADYFTRALPEPQKGPDIYLPLGLSAPVTSSATQLNVHGTGKSLGLLGYYDDGEATPAYYGAALQGDNLGGLNLSSGYGHDIGTEDTLMVSMKGALGLTTDTSKSGIVADLPKLTADLSQANGATINQLRQAFAIQRMYEIDARGGRAEACASSIKKSRKKTGRLNQLAS